MRGLKTSLLCVIASGYIVSFVLAAGDVSKGKVLFNDPRLSGASAGVSCNSCHPDGKGLEKAAKRKDLQKVVNSCIENALKGKAVDPKSDEMANLVAYIKSLEKDSSGAGGGK
jgi:cytochrome c553